MYCCVQRIWKVDLIEMYIFTELVGTQMILMNTLGTLLSGETRTKEGVQALFVQIQKMRAAQAEELLVRRAQQAVQKRLFPR